MLYSISTTTKAAERRETQYFENVREPRDLPQGLGGGDAVIGTPWVLTGRKARAARGRRLGALRHEQGLDPGDTTCRSRCRKKLHELQRSVAHRGDALQRAADRRPGCREDESDTAGRPVLIKGNTQLLFGGMGRLSENCVLNIK